MRTIFRGDIPLTDLPREALRRKKIAAHQKQERRSLEKLAGTQAGLAPQFAPLPPADLLTHFRQRNVSFFPVNDLGQIAKLHKGPFPVETEQLIREADAIANESRWELAGLGSFEFESESFWRRDPITGKDWGLEYHADVTVYENDRVDIRVLWELNRFGHAMKLACAYALTREEKYAETFFAHVENWMQQNPYGRGANWNCAMEAALRSINILAAFDIFRRSKGLTDQRLAVILKLLDQHGRFIFENNEFSYIATSNHYLSDVVGLFWIGTLLPELEEAAKWRDFGLREMLREMDKQILSDGADFESSTGYHKFVTEMFLYSFILAECNGVKVEQRHLEKLRSMLQYLRKILRPDNRIPLIGDADGSQIVSVVKRDADDVAYLLSVGAAFLKDQEIKTSQSAPEVLWTLGQNGLDRLEKMSEVKNIPSTAFSDAGAYILRDGDLYLHFNANDCGVNGRGSHAHNDAFSIEVSAFGRPFIIDPGSCVYNLDREARHLFRSTAYHSTVMIDDEEQNMTDQELPFIIGNEARPIVDRWRVSDQPNCVSGEHFGYTRLAEPIIHRRTVEFFKQDRYWLIEDKFTGKGRHKFSFSFHLAPGLGVNDVDESTVTIGDSDNRKLFLGIMDINAKHKIIPASVSRNYGHRESSSILRWEIIADAPFGIRFWIGLAFVVFN